MSSADAHGMRRTGDERMLTFALTLAVLLPLLAFFVVPLVAILGKSLLTPAGLGLGNYLRIVGSARFIELKGSPPVDAAPPAVGWAELRDGSGRVLRKRSVKNMVPIAGGYVKIAGS